MGFWSSLRAGVAAQCNSAPSPQAVKGKDILTPDKENEEETNERSIEVSEAAHAPETREARSTQTSSRNIRSKALPAQTNPRATTLSHRPYAFLVAVRKVSGSGSSVAHASCYALGFRV